MILFRKVNDIKLFLDTKRKNNIDYAFVPTMGALHNGHITLINAAKKDGLFTVCSIFINPTQFTNQQDFSKYPTTIENDIYQLEKAGCDVLFLPSADEVYPNGLQSAIHYELGYLESILEGEFRPGHFQGVCQVVQRLLEIVQPTKLFMGQKDYQQCMVIKKLIAIMGISTQLIICPTQREISGLAMSSRNMRLNDTEKIQATKIYENLLFIQKNIRSADIQTIKEIAANNLTANGFKIDYVEIANANTLQLIESWDKKTPLVVLIAAYLNEVRLIDNLLITN